ncbi:MAG: hypothetical protein QNK23_16690 [Crocinitomicaceae bacterium]|nr:hypothetical protein [Crocinitomicaceae bacterium]
MKNTVTSILLLLTISFFFTSCTDEESSDSDTPQEQTAEEYTANSEELQFEQWMMEIDMNDSLDSGNSLYYSKPSGESIEVEIFLNDSSELIKAVESYTMPGSYSILRKYFYLREGKKFATRELFEDTLNGGGFSERITFYNSDEQPIATKQRTADFEEHLDFETFAITANHDCTIDRVMRVLNKEAEFAITFQGFVSDGGATYLIVGEDDPDGFATTLIIQFVDETIQYLQMYESESIGKPMKLTFEKRDDGQGFEYQLLYGAVLE